MHTQPHAALVGLCLSLAAASAAADNWKVLPATDAGFKPDFTLSAAVGSMNPEHLDSDTYLGAELAFNCLLLQPSTGSIRTRISLGRFDDQGTELTSFEINPRWTVKLDKNLSVGVGPGIGYVNADVGGRSTHLLAVQVGADLDYRIGALNLGLGARWQDTRDRQVAPGRSGADNFLVQAKVGVNF